MFFPLFGRFIKAYKVRVCGRFPMFLHNTIVALHVNNFALDRTQTAQQEIEQKKKMEREASEEKQQPSSPSKAGSQKVRY